MREPEKVKVRHQHLVAPVLGRFWLVAEIDHTGLVRVKFQPVFPKPLVKHFQHPFGVILICKQHDKVSSAEEPPLHALAELYVSLSTHTAPIIQPLAARISSEQTALAGIAQFALANAL